MDTAPEILHPYTLIDTIFNEELIREDVYKYSKAGENWLRKVSTTFSKVFSTEEAYNKVPRLGPTSIPGRLVRVYGIVQDIFDPELYSQCLIAGDTGHVDSNDEYINDEFFIPYAFRDKIPPVEGHGTDYSKHLETRVSIVLSPIPGESEWVKEYEKEGKKIRVTPGYSSPGRRDEISDEKTNALRKMKRTIRSDEEGFIDNDEGNDAIMTSGVSDDFRKSRQEEISSSRTLVEMESSSSSFLSSLSSSSSSSSSFALKPNGHHIENSSTINQEIGISALSFVSVGASIQIPESAVYSGGQIIVRTYGEDTILKVGDMVEVLGIYTHDPELTEFDSAMDEEEEGGGGGEKMFTEEISAKRSATFEGDLSLSSSVVDVNKKTSTDHSIGMCNAAFPGMFTAAFPEDEISKNPPASRVPRVHAILVRSLSTTYPLLQPPLGTVISITSTATPSPPSSSLSPASSPPPPSSSSSTASSLSLHSSSFSIEPFGLRDPCAPIVMSQSTSISKNGALFNEQEAAQHRSLLVRSKREALQRNAAIYLPSMISSTGMTIKDMRNELFSFLSREVLLGDMFVTEYLLLHMLSQVRMRKDVTVLDKFSLNIMGFNEDTPDKPNAIQTIGKRGGLLKISRIADHIQNGISRLLPRTKCIPLRIDTLNSICLAPRRDPVTSRIEANELQLGAGTYLIIDELVVNAGQLNPVGLGGLQALQSVSSSQTLPYDFTHFSTFFDVDIPTLVLSHRRPLVKADITVQMSTSSIDDSRSLTSLPQHPVSSSLLPYNPSYDIFFERSRPYLACVRNLPYTIPQDVSVYIENDLVKARSEDLSLKAEDLHQWLILARLSALSHGEQELTIDRWTSVVKMEKSRIDSLRAKGGPTGGSS